MNSDSFLVLVGYLRQCVLSDITVAITQVAANKLKIKIDAKCDLGSSHCYHAIGPWHSVIL